jgi:hypothetical protein
MAWKRRSKYRAVRTEVDGFIFHSKKEAARFVELKLLERSGIIKGLQRQVPYILTAHGEKIGKIVMDFVYTQDGVVIYEDVKSKGTITPLFRWKAKHFKAQYKVSVTVYL